MKDTSRLILLVLVNITIVFGIFGYAIVNNIDLSRRLIDLTTSSEDLGFTCILVIGMLAGFMSNLFILSYNKGYKRDLEIIQQQLEAMKKIKNEPHIYREGTTG